VPIAVHQLEAKGFERLVSKQVLQFIPQHIAPTS
jgi:hypothetical protein